MSTPQLTDPRWTLTLAITALENWGRHFEWCSSLKPPYYPEWPYTNDPLPLSCDCGLSTQTAELRLMRDTIPSPAPLLPVPEAAPTLKDLRHAFELGVEWGSMKSAKVGPPNLYTDAAAEAARLYPGAAQHEEGPLPATPPEGKQ